MMSKDKRAEAEKAIRESMHIAVSAKETAETDMFKCGKCKQRKTKYFQMQTRSADEPMVCIFCIEGFLSQFMPQSV
jgi:transcription elongation factor S-II